MRSPRGSSAILETEAVRPSLAGRRRSSFPLAILIGALIKRARKAVDVFVSSAVAKFAHAASRSRRSRRPPSPRDRASRARFRAPRVVGQPAVPPSP
ncbi:hypothetical protein IscW_ISCW009383 [Ixodes scapularis]|uniref:Uncharacterized protein n=1 Tax=Ixodes scapularis TaxID=6945 RepID=B7Q2W9_IXOSC|nr:hypothetical protein IscW_ISCW009383 [Ixodes scapularis]|eukprot:XP_002411067.1 hypothetical protein IscW_ISCW009383 [Ixodes scapularis]